MQCPMSQTRFDVMLSGKIAVVTGSNRGIGFSIAQMFVREGAKVIVCMRRLDDAVVSKIGPSEQVFGVSLDLEDPESIRASVARIGTISNKKVDILVNNAGSPSGSLFQMTSSSELRRVFEVNFFGHLAFTQNLIRFISRSDGGSIINIASTSAERSDAGTLAYGSAKAALIHATRTLATELGGKGIRVNAVSPGITKTEMYDQMDPSLRDLLVNSAAFTRAANPDEIASGVLFLASDLSKFVTGQVLKIDGGMR